MTRWSDGLLEEFPEWTTEDTEALLNRFELPPGVVWLDQDGVTHDVVERKYAARKGYGFWLRTSPRWRHVFSAIHRTLAGGMAAKVLAAVREYDATGNAAPLRAVLRETVTAAGGHLGFPNGVARKMSY